MGNCLGRDGVGVGNEKIQNTTTHASIHQGMLRERKLDVYEKYIEREVMGQGSMGHVARVQVREGLEGGSAFTNSNSSSGIDNNSKSSPSDNSSSLSERRKTKLDYALKSIQLDRVSPQFLEELRNEIDILKEMVGSREMYSVWCCLRGTNYGAGSHGNLPALLYRTILILSRPTKSIRTRSEFASFWNCVTVGTCTRDFLIRRSEHRALRAN